MYSFDIYDTLITRKTYEPQGIFDLMGYYMLSDTKKWRVSEEFILDFRSIRVNAEKTARLMSDKEVTLQEIYNCMSVMRNVDDSVIGSIMQLEIQVESMCTILIQENIEKIKQLLNENEQVVLISDMYLPVDFFRQVFDKICPMLNKLPIYVSCNEGVTKASGMLYKRVMEKEGVSYSEWFHLGDNISSDVNIPRLLGIKATLYSKDKDEAMLSRLTNLYSNCNPALRQILMGMVTKISPVENNAYRIGFSMVSVILYAYVKWVIFQAKEYGISQLGFIARDGYVLKQIADVIIAEENLNISTRYIYGSRKAWRVNDEQKRNLVKEYLEQEFGKELDKVALVDTQGTAKSIDYLSDICKHRFIVFYYVLLENPSDKEVTVIPYSVNYGGNVIEAFCRAPHGSTIEYKKQNGFIVPVLTETDKTVLDNSNLFSFVNGVLDASKEICFFEKQFGISLPFITIADRLLHYWCDNPDYELAEFIGEIPHDTNNDNETNVFAPRLSLDEIREIEFVRTSQDIESVYKGVDIRTSYKRLDKGAIDFANKCKQEYYEQEVIKDTDCKNIIIYGFGVYGRELYHRLFCLKNVKVNLVVDANASRYSGDVVEVMPPEMINETEYDYIVISLLNTRICQEIRNMLCEAGVPSSKVIYREECLNRFITD